MPMYEDDHSEPYPEVREGVFAFLSKARNQACAIGYRTSLIQVLCVGITRWAGIHWVEGS